MHARFPRLCLTFVLASILIPARAYPAAAQPADTLVMSLQEVVERALAASPEVGIQAAEVQQAEARKDFALANRFLTDFRLETQHSVAPGMDIPEGNTLPKDALYLNPDVRNDWDHLRPFNRAEVQVVQPLFTGGQIKYSIRAARYGVDVEAADVDATSLQVALRTGELYYGLGLARALQRLTGRAGDIVAQAKREIRRLLDEGASDVDDADLQQVLITEQEYLRRVVEVRERLATAEVALARQLFLPRGTAIAPTSATLEPLAFQADSLESYFVIALDHRPEMAKARAGLQAREALVKVAKSDFYPKLALAASTSYAYAEGRYRQKNAYVGDAFLGRSLLAGLGLRYNLNVVQTRAKVEQASADLAEVRYQFDAAEQLVLFQVEEAYRNLTIARSAMESAQEALRISRDWLQFESVNFDLDLGDTENLVKAVQANLELEAGYYESVQRFNVAVLRLHNATGTLEEKIESGTLVE